MSRTWLNVFVPEIWFIRKRVELFFSIEAITCWLANVVGLVGHNWCLWFMDPEILGRRCWPIGSLFLKFAPIKVVIWKFSSLIVWGIINAAWCLGYSPLCHFIRWIILMKYASSQRTLIEIYDMWNFVFFEDIICFYPANISCGSFVCYFMLERAPVCCWRRLIFHVHNWFRSKWFTLAHGVISWFSTVYDSLVITIIV